MKTHPPRWVVDTNVLVSAFLWHGTPGRVIEVAGGHHVRLYTSRILLEELVATLAKKKLARYVAATGLTADEMVGHYRHLASVVTAAPLDRPVSRDVDDDAVLACAVAARADLIVSGDDDLLTLKQFRGITISTAAQAIRGLGRVG